LTLNFEEIGSIVVKMQKRRRKMSQSNLETIILCFLLLVTFAMILATLMTFHSEFVNDHHYVKELILLSLPSTVNVTTSVRGNLGPPSVLVEPSVERWLKDRWQAASDMHGSAIKGGHWVTLNFINPMNNSQKDIVLVKKIVLDWESAFSEDYVLKGSFQQPSPERQSFVIYDSYSGENSDVNYRNKKAKRTIEEYGQSPGVQFKMPLHIVHTIELNEAISLDTLYLEIRKPGKHGWGVSLWKIEVFGTK
jgi:hypothetical protein